MLVTDKLETKGLAFIFRAIVGETSALAPPLFPTRCEMAVTKACIMVVTGCADEVRLNDMYQAGVRPVISLFNRRISLMGPDGVTIASCGGKYDG